MALVTGSLQLKARLQGKGKLRPYEMVRKKLPDGTAELAHVPKRRSEAGIPAHNLNVYVYVFSY